ncbi:hypothetical protein [Aureibacillus halotolerans]|uniref:Uncharacterized protein n=1 Tax=Aureibacillus halotolerans TaxID=1508390 RepID=A0A4R6U837_9BACI|nr:hypothetical protein [Aureibacillus halotolerans]TDQ39224.1 hypothetical protein EV213_108176 [Aureibacillus halotolerans]
MSDKYEALHSALELRFKDGRAINNHLESLFIKLQRTLEYVVDNPKNPFEVSVNKLQGEYKVSLFGKETASITFNVYKDRGRMVVEINNKISEESDIFFEDGKFLLSEKDKDSDLIDFDDDAFEEKLNTTFVTRF